MAHTCNLALQRQEDHLKFKAGLGYMIKPCIKTKANKSTNQVPPRVRAGSGSRRSDGAATHQLGALNALSRPELPSQQPCWYLIIVLSEGSGLHAHLQRPHRDTQLESYRKPKQKATSQIGFLHLPQETANMVNFKCICFRY